MKIGIPNSLLYQYYISFWKPFFEELGFEVVISHMTTKTILDRGVRKMVPEICVPMKIYAGHVIELLNQDVDYIYVPRFVSITEHEAFCPKFMALPDMLKTAIPHCEEKLLTHSIVSDTDDIAVPKNYIELADKLKKSKRDITKAVKNARKKWLEYRNLCVKDKYTSAEANNKVLFNKEPKGKNKSGDVKIGVVGYVYDIYDEFISMNVIDKLNELGAQVETFEMLEDKTIKKELKRFPKRFFWTFSNKTIASAYNFFERDDVDGVIHVTAFGCGPDSFIGKYLELDCDKYEKPFMTLRIDEHTGENHLRTRIEAFVDMLIKLKQEKEAE